MPRRRSTSAHGGDFGEVTCGQDMPGRDPPLPATRRVAPTTTTLPTRGSAKVVSVHIDITAKGSGLGFVQLMVTMIICAPHAVAYEPLYRASAPLPVR